MARLTTVGRELLVFKPDKDTARLSTVGQQILAGVPLAPLRVSAAYQEVLIQGTPDSSVRLSDVAMEILAAPEYLPVRLTSALQEMLIQGAPDSTVRLSTVGREILTAAPGQPIRISSAFQEVLEAVDNDFAPGKLNRSQRVSSMSADYPDASLPQSALDVTTGYQRAALSTEYVFVRSEGQFAQVVHITTLDREIPPPAGRLYQSLSTASLATSYPAYELPQSDLEVHTAIQSAALASAYPDKDQILSEGTLAGVALWTTLPAEYPAYELPQSDLEVRWAGQLVVTGDIYRPKADVLSDLHVTVGNQRSALAGTYIDKDEILSDIYVAAGDQRGALTADYPNPRPAQSTLEIRGAAQTLLAKSAYLPVAKIKPNLGIAGVRHLATVPAGWLDTQVTLLRLHAAMVIATHPVPVERYPDPADIRAPAEVLLALQPVVIDSDRGLTKTTEASSALFVSQMITIYARKAIYSKATDPQTEVIVSDLAMFTVESDDFFENQADAPITYQPVVSIQLIYD